MAELRESFSLAHALLRVGIQNFVQSFLPGAAVFGSLFEEVALRFCESAWTWLSQRSPEEQRQTLRQLARLPASEAQAIADEELARHPDLPPERRRELLHFSSTIALTAAKAMGLREGEPIAP